jgi:hypothetical protein
MWLLFPQLARHNIRPAQRRRSTRLVEYALARQRPGLNIVKREKWTEADVDELPAEEPDVFERKSGELFANRGKFLDVVAKALSAFANSGGGSLILGVNDDGTPDGLPPLVGQTAMRDWVEQTIPHLLDYPLADFRVHTVIKSDPRASRTAAKWSSSMLVMAPQHLIKASATKSIIAARAADPCPLHIFIWSCFGNG